MRRDQQPRFDLIQRLLSQPRRLIISILIGNKTLEDVMTARSDIFSLSMEMPIDEIIVEVCKSCHTKIPIYRENRDNVCGILHARDLLAIDMGSFRERSSKEEELPSLFSAVRPRPPRKCVCAGDPSVPPL
jgi:Mg2+/Co2+ transporter CorB